MKTITVTVHPAPDTPVYSGPTEFVGTFGEIFEVGRFTTEDDADSIELAVSGYPNVLGPSLRPPDPRFAIEEPFKGSFGFKGRSVTPTGLPSKWVKQTISVEVRDSLAVINVAEGVEDTPIPLLIKVPEGTSYITLSGLPKGSTLSKGEEISAGEWRVTADELPIELLPPHNYSGEFTISVEAWTRPADPPAPPVNGNPPMTATEIRESGFVPNYDFTLPVDPSASDGMKIHRNMPEVAGRPDLGIPFPAWTALYLIDGGDRARQNMLRIEADNPWGPKGSGGFTLDDAHGPLLGVIPYLATGDAMYKDAAIAQGRYLRDRVPMAMDLPCNDAQVRGAARVMCINGYIAAALKDQDATDYVNRNLDHAANLVAKGYFDQFGELAGYIPRDRAVADDDLAVWEDDFYLLALLELDRLGFRRREFLEKKAAFNVAHGGRSYRTSKRDKVTNVPFTTWAQVRAAENPGTGFSLPNAPDGYTAIGRCAMARCAEIGIKGADAAFHVLDDVIKAGDAERKMRQRPEFSTGYA